MVGLDGNVYIIGGYAGSQRAITDVVEIYQPDTGSTAVSRLSSPRANVAATLGPDGRIYVLGGVDAAGDAVATVEAYGPVVTATPSTAPPGGSVVVTGKNFAADAIVTLSRLTDGSQTAYTDETGAFSVTLNLSPTTVSGTLIFSAVDNNSNYPALGQLSVQ